MHRAAHAAGEALPMFKRAMDRLSQSQSHPYATSNPQKGLTMSM